MAASPPPNAEVESILFPNKQVENPPATPEASPPGATSAPGSSVPANPQADSLLFPQGNDPSSAVPQNQPTPVAVQAPGAETPAVNMQLGGKNFRVGMGPDADITPDEFHRRFEQSVEQRTEAKFNKERTALRRELDILKNESAKQRTQTSQDRIAAMLQHAPHEDQQVGTESQQFTRAAETLQDQDGRLSDLEKMVKEMAARVSPVENATAVSGLRDAVNTAIASRAPGANISAEEVFQSAMGARERLAEDPDFGAGWGNNATGQAILADVALTSVLGRDKSTPNANTGPQAAPQGAVPPQGPAQSATANPTGPPAPDGSGVLVESEFSGTVDDEVLRLIEASRQGGS